MALVNGYLVMRYGMRRLANLAVVGTTFASLASWAGERPRGTLICTGADWPTAFSIMGIGRPRPSSAN